MKWNLLADLLMRSRFDYKFHISIYHDRSSSRPYTLLMNDRSMGWDPSLLRKYSSTGHFRLLNQLKGDLGKRPLDRDPATRAVRMPGAGSRSRRPVNQVPRRSTQVAPVPVTVPVSSPEPSSFRDRLSAIEMR